MSKIRGAAQAGHDTGLAVLAGTMTAEQAGDRWVIWADRSHTSGIAFLKAYEATGAAR